MSKRNQDQVIHPSEQDGYISGAYLDRIYDEAWFRSKNDHAWVEYNAAVALFESRRES